MFLQTAKLQIFSETRTSEPLNIIVLCYFKSKTDAQYKKITTFAQ